MARSLKSEPQPPRASHLPHLCTRPRAPCDAEAEGQEEEQEEQEEEEEEEGEQEKEEETQQEQQEQGQGQEEEQEEEEEARREGGHDILRALSPSSYSGASTTSTSGWPQPLARLSLCCTPLSLWQVFL